MGKKNSLGNISLSVHVCVTESDHEGDEDAALHDVEL